MAKLILAVIAVAFATLVEAQKCEPKFDPKPDCRKEAAEGWVYFSSMGYKLFAKKLTKQQADQACKPWDERICSASRGWQSWLVSYLADGEWEKAIMKAYDEACIKSSHLFWTGVNKISRNKLYYTDSSRSTSTKHKFPGSPPRSLGRNNCVAINAETREMVELPCNTPLPYMCKIMPVRH